MTVWTIGSFLAAPVYLIEPPLSVHADRSFVRLVGWPVHADESSVHVPSSPLASSAQRKAIGKAVLGRAGLSQAPRADALGGLPPGKASCCPSLRAEPAATAAEQGG